MALRKLARELAAQATISAILRALIGAGVARERRREIVQKANLLTSDKVATMFVFHPVSPLVTRKEVNFPAAYRIPDLVDLDLVTVSG